MSIGAGMGLVAFDSLRVRVKACKPWTDEELADGVVPESLIRSEFCATCCEDCNEGCPLRKLLDKAKGGA